MKVLYFLLLWMFLETAPLILQLSLFTRQRKKVAEKSRAPLYCAQSYLAARTCVRARDERRICYICIIL